MKILAIETSCDETAFALVEAGGGLISPKFKIIENVVSSQISIHRPWGGVVPNLAKREHQKNLPIIFKKLLDKIEPSSIGILAVTVGPGLEPALWTGVEFAKEIHKKYFPKAKLIGANHLEGHLYSFLLSQSKTTHYSLPTTNLFPAIALVVSGGHTILLRMDSLTKWKKLGETRDDAVGEAFDKAAKMLELPYPGGPEIQKLAEDGNPNAIPFPRPMMHTKDYNFSFSGLKTSVLYYLRDLQTTHYSLQTKADVAASFQKAAIDVLTHKTSRAAQEYRAKSIFLSGGVAANSALRESLKTLSSKLKTNFFVPPITFNTDNAVMIAVAGYMSYLRKKNKRITAQANLSL
ncbi:MAG: tRNA (adenosine(37)-N6)-threonylcarbamoyltransferase complex transferase subunit TsaD [Candidatus Jorgensenbacteria bacterium]|nr:tRNA (adenosine(37)-N6)-threonylcarbamoyltransferase complex transferase subunit TsaD [Candidatus Jorgensenbacteria bacterium]